MCDGWITADGVCITPTLPINTYTLNPVTELPNTGYEPNIIIGAVILLLGIIIFALDRRFR